MRRQTILNSFLDLAIYVSIFLTVLWASGGEQLSHSCFNKFYVTSSRDLIDTCWWRQDEKSEDSTAVTEIKVGQDLQTSLEIWKNS